MIAQLCLIAIVTALCGLVLRDYQHSLLPLILMAGGILLFFTVYDYAVVSLEFIRQLSQHSGIETDVVRLLIKLLGIGMILDLASSLVLDMGFPSLSDKLVLCGKILMFGLSIPIFQNLIDLISSLEGLLS